jgi:hypothetical protein
MRRYLKRYLRFALGERGRALLRRSRHTLGLVPRVNRSARQSLHFPGGRSAAIVISADLELAWAWRYARRVKDPLCYARQRARQGRQNLVGLLDLCDKYGLPVTWATVGHLLLGHCSRSNGRAHPELPRVPYFENDLWAYQSGDWFDADPGSASPNDRDWADWHGPDLIRSILERGVEHEIACHSFSHIAFSDEHCPAEVAGAELRRCQELAGNWGLALRSFIFPGDLPGNFASVRDAGFRGYRWQGRYDIDAPQRDQFGLWRVPATACLDKPYSMWTAAEHVSLLRRYINAAVDHGLVCGFWFHTEMDSLDVKEVLPMIFEYIASRRSDLWVTTMGGLTQWLDSNMVPAK